MPLVDIAIVADDLTGALDAAAPFAAHGAATRVSMTPDLDRLGTPMPSVLSVSTTSRHMTPADAATVVSDACHRLAGLEPGFWFKKIDSTLRGNVAAEIVAAMASAKLDHAVVCPAVPDHGRTVVGGIVRVDGVPLPETDFVCDAVSPASPVPLAEQFREIGCALTAESRATVPKDALDPKGIWIVDASDINALNDISSWLVERNGRSLAVGAAGLGEALAEALAGPCAAATQRRVSGPVLYVIGSRAARTDAQVAALLERHTECRLIDARAGRFDAEHEAQKLVAGDSAVIRIPHRADDPSADVVAQSLGRNTADLLAKVDFGTLFLTGGDTASAVLAAINRPVIALDGEVVPGVPRGHVDFHGKPLQLITKAGGFGGRDLLADLESAARG